MSETEKSDSAAIAAACWWRELNSNAAGGHLTRGARRAALARLRRAATPLEAIQEPQALVLIARLPGEKPDRVAALAGILAFVREDRKDRPVARAIGRKSLDDVDSAKMSEGRFRRLLQAEDQELMEAMRRLVRLTKGKANVYDLCFATLRWGDGVKKRWIFEYYNVAGAALQASPPASPAT